MTTTSGRRKSKNFLRLRREHQRPIQGPGRRPRDLSVRTPNRDEQCLRSQRIWSAWSKPNGIGIQSDTPKDWRTTTTYYSVYYKRRKIKEQVGELVRKTTRITQEGIRQETQSETPKKTEEATTAYKKLWKASFWGNLQHWSGHQGSK